eukprot:scaffold91703_cov53-Attheya_sp.AAC.8
MDLGYALSEHAECDVGVYPRLVKILLALRHSRKHTAVRGNQISSSQAMSSLERLSAMKRCDWFKKGESDV